MIIGGRTTSGKRARSGAGPKGDRHRLIVISIADRLASPHLQTLAKKLIAKHETSGLTKPEFAEKIGMSGSQFRYVRRCLANPSIVKLATIAKALNTPLYELLENDSLGDRKNLSGPKMVDHFAAVVNQRYKQSGLNKNEFAKLICVSLPQLYLILNGTSNPSLLVVVGIGDRLGLGLWELLGVEPLRAGIREHV
jgi:transcriptional regulator with XRE-family HTH domain